MDAIYFNHAGHKSFYYKMLKKTHKRNDACHRALFYLLGVSKHTRRHIEDIFDFENRNIRPKAIYAIWQTGSSARLTRLAFNLWNGWTEKGGEWLSAPSELFDCGLAPFFLEALKLRYPDCNNRK